MRTFLPFLFAGLLVGTLCVPDASAAIGRVMVYCDTTTCGMTQGDGGPGSCFAPPGYGTLDLCTYCDQYIPATGCAGWALGIGTGSVTNMDLGRPQVSTLCGRDPRNCYNVWVNRNAQPISPWESCDGSNAYVGIEKPGQDIYLCMSTVNNW